MAAALGEEYNVERALSAIREDFTISPATRASRIADARRSMSTTIKKTSSKNTIFKIANTMVGSCMIVFPNIFYESGILTTIIVSFIIGLISCKTAVLEVIHFNHETETDFSEVVERILGKKHKGEGWRGEGWRMMGKWRGGEEEQQWSNLGDPGA